MPVRYIPHPITALRTTPVRALDPGLFAFVNVYQNLRLRPISVQVSCECTRVNVLQNARFVAYTGPGGGPNPGDVAGYGGFRGGPGMTPCFAHFFTEFMVPPGIYYRVAADVGAANIVALNIWVEIEL